MRLAQVLSNLLTNAAKYTAPGGRIQLRATSSGDECEFEVEDNGIGLGAESLERIFDMFSQETNAIERADGGLGIGLALVRAIVQLHGGTVTARSDGPGSGTTFVVRLPGAVADAPVADAGAPEQDVQNARSALRILVADDNLSAVELLSELLSLEGHSVTIATDGAQALDLAKSLRPSIAILDIGMPRLNGYEIAAGIRATTWGAGVYLIAATGWGQEGDKARARAAGFDLHLTKPFDPQVLLDAVGARHGSG
ncbi:MAG: hybrid sensor histidine kinase/response regulator [Variovorax sp.]